MAISKNLIAAVVVALVFVGAADVVPPASAEGYYHKNFENSPEGVYEWHERDLIFVKVKVPRKGRLDDQELAATSRALRIWLGGKAAKKRVDPVYPFGKNAIREICRSYLPDWEYRAAWNYSGDSCAFTYELKEGRVVVTVFRGSEILKTMPAAFLEPVRDEVWIRGLKYIVSHHYKQQNDVSFMWRLGAIDCCEAASAPQKDFPVWASKDFSKAREQFLVKAQARWLEVNSPAHEEYEQVSKELVAYLRDSELAKRLERDARRVLVGDPQTTFFWGASIQNAETNRVVTCTTNVLAHAKPASKVERFVQNPRELALPISVVSNLVVSVKEEQDDSVVQEVETITIVRKTERVVRKRKTTLTGEPLFEKLFLAGGCIANVEAPRTALGAKAVVAFKSKLRAGEREELILSALRENPSDKDLWNLFGRILQEKQDHLGAIVCFRNALRLDRTHVYALTNLAKSYESLNRKHLACAMAMLVEALASDKWCLERAGGILTREW